MKDIPVSIVLPLYNGEVFIRETLNSIAAQTFQDAELIIVNDGSTDGSAAIIEQYCTHVSVPIIQRLSLLHQSNQGVAGARNHGIREARGQWIAFVDQDDVWEREKLARQMSAVSEPDGPGWHYTAFARFYASGKRVDKVNGSADRIKTLCRLTGGELFIPPSTALVRRELCEAVGGFDSAFVPSDDWDFFLKLAEQYQPGYLPETLVRFRSHAGSTGKQHKRKIFEAQARVLSRHESALSGIIPREIISRRLANVEWHIGREYQQEGETAEARNHFRRAINLHPGRIKFIASWLKTFLGRL